jgi:NAD(P)-dependent dehydrogenase (short-subunit alcohol dehydrogenase family)
MELEGRIAVVTGGSRGIGQAVCVRLAAERARIAILDVLPPDETRALLTEFRADAWFAQTDLARPEEIEAAFARLDEECGVPAVLVNAAGIFADVPFLETTVDLWDRVMNVNARGLFFASQAAARRMRGNGGGRIVNIVSTAAAQGFALESVYCASKGAALLLTRTFAIELARDGIVVNAVGPGTVQTAMGADYLGNGPIAAHELSRTPLGRFGRPEEIAEAVAFLATRASWVTGEVLYVDGGFLAAGLSLLEGLT